MLDLIIFTYGIWSHCTWTKYGQSQDFRKSNICPHFVLEQKISHNIYHGPCYLDIHWTNIPLLSSICPTCPLSQIMDKVWTIVGQKLDNLVHLRGQAVFDWWVGKGRWATKHRSSLLLSQTIWLLVFPANKSYIYSAQTKINQEHWVSIVNQVRGG